MYDIVIGNQLCLLVNIYSRDYYTIIQQYYNNILIEKKMYVILLLFIQSYNEFFMLCILGLLYQCLDHIFFIDFLTVNRCFMRCGS